MGGGHPPSAPCSAGPGPDGGLRGRGGRWAGAERWANVCAPVVRRGVGCNPYMFVRIMSERGFAVRQRPFPGWMRSLTYGKAGSGTVQLAAQTFDQPPALRPTPPPGADPAPGPGPAEREAVGGWPPRHPLLHGERAERLTRRTPAPASTGAPSGCANPPDGDPESAA